MFYHMGGAYKIHYLDYMKCQYTLYMISITVGESVATTEFIRGGKAGTDFPH